ncbi:MAG: aldehyde dehydrogenase family protein, partial [Pseudolabrys sp.]
IIELPEARELTEEVFGPVLHAVRWRSGELDRLIDDIAGNGTALTLGIHTRIDATVAHIVGRLSHGNIYVNRNMIGAVVGSQPFGGSGLSGTGPKAGGPDYLHRLALEQVVTVNTAASGGNAALLAEEE